MTNAPSDRSERGEASDAARGGRQAPSRLSELASFLPLALLALELLALQGRFSVAHLLQQDAAWAQVAVVLRDLPRIGLLALTAAALLGYRRLLEELSLLGRAAVGAGSRWGWTGVQLGVFALLWAGAPPLFDPDRHGPPPWPLVIGWPALGLLALALALRACAPWEAWLGLARRRWRLVAAAIAVGLVAWTAGIWSQAGLRESLRLPTLRVAYYLLYPFAEGAYIAPHAFEFGTAHFAVDLAPECSGLDGIGLVGTFALAWLWWERKQLRFPRALLLLPLGVVTSWLLNAARLAALVLVGEHASGEAAIAGFHSVAGLVLFCATAVGLVVVGHSDAFQRTPDRGRAPLLDATAGFLLPLMLWIGVGLLATAFPVEPTARLALRGVAVGTVLVAARSHLGELLRPPTWWGAVLGILGIGLALLLPVGLQEGVMVEHDPQDAVQGLAAALATLIGAPLVEELAFRGYLMRRFTSAHFETVDPHRAGWAGIAVSSLLFGVLHPAWIPGVAFGLLFALAYRARGRLTDAILAHALANLALLIALR